MTETPKKPRKKRTTKKKPPSVNQVKGTDLKIVLCSNKKSFPATEIVMNALSLPPDEITLEGMKFAEYLRINCSGNYLDGIRKVLLENKRISTFNPPRR